MRFFGKKKEDPVKSDKTSDHGTRPVKSDKTSDHGTRPVKSDKTSDHGTSKKESVQDAVVEDAPKKDSVKSTEKSDHKTDVKEEKKSKSKNGTDDKKKDKKKKIVKSEGAKAYGLIIAPLVTEKSHAQTDLHVYSFRIHKKANKADVKEAIEALYDVSVERVNIVNMPVRRRTIGRNRGYQSAYKKALVKVGADDKIDFFEGV